MKRIIDYIETSCSDLKDNNTTYRYKKKVLDQMLTRADEVIHSGLKDEKVMLDLLADEVGDLKDGYKTFLDEEKKNRRKKLMKIGFPVGGLVTLLAILAAFFIVSDITGAWNKTWLIIVGGIFSMIIFFLSFAIRKLCSMRRIFQPFARVLLAMCVMLVTVFAFLFCLMMFPSLTVWPILPAGVSLMFIADLILAFATKQKFRTISLLVYLPAIAAMFYIVFAGYSIVTWSAGWIIILLGLVADIIYIFSVLMSNMKYFTYKQEVDE